MTTPAPKQRAARYRETRLDPGRLTYRGGGYVQRMVMAVPVDDPPPGVPPSCLMEPSRFVHLFSPQVSNVANRGRSSARLDSQIAEGGRSTSDSSSCQ